MTGIVLELKSYYACHPFNYACLFLLHSSEQKKLTKQI